MEVKIISKTPNMLRTCYVAARTCYSSDSPIELLEQNKSGAEMLRLLDRIIKSKHLSVLEHNSITFAIKNVSRTLLAQYSRHRIGISLSVQSQRYVSESSEKNNKLFDLVIPESIEKDQEAKMAYNQLMQEIQNTYDFLINKTLPKQDVRFILPGAAGTNFVTTLNLRSFMDIYEKRVTIPGAQWEIKNLLIAMRNELVKEEAWLIPYLSVPEENK